MPNGSNPTTPEGRSKAAIVINAQKKSPDPLLERESGLSESQLRVFSSDDQRIG
jgi:hypothetical protein